MREPSKDKFRGAFLGLAIGDALGTTLEFQPRGSFISLTDMVGGGPFDLNPGEWTDDTSMALCLAQSLLRKGGMDLVDQLESYLDWWKHGDNSVTGECFDIGNTVRRSLENFSLFRSPYSGSTARDSAGNGSIMRLCPVPLFFSGNPEKAITEAAESSKTTHGALEAVDACRFLAAVILGGVQGRGKGDVLSPQLFGEITNSSKLCSSIKLLSDGAYKTKVETEISGSGYVVRSLEAALWAFQQSDNFREGALKAVNLGDDADTTAAVYGQIAGAYYGLSGIPKSWLQKLAWRKRLTGIADKLYEASQKVSL